MSQQEPKKIFLKGNKLQLLLQKAKKESILNYIFNETDITDKASRLSAYDRLIYDLPDFVARRLENNQGLHNDMYEPFDFEGEAYLHYDEPNRGYGNMIFSQYDDGNEHIDKLNDYYPFTQAIEQLQGELDGNIMSDIEAYVSNVSDLGLDADDMFQTIQERIDESSYEEFPYYSDQMLFLGHDEKKLSDMYDESDLDEIVGQQREQTIDAVRDDINDEISSANREVNEYEYGDKIKGLYENSKMIDYLTNNPEDDDGEKQEKIRNQRVLSMEIKGLVNNNDFDYYTQKLKDIEIFKNQLERLNELDAFNDRFGDMEVFDDEEDEDFEGQTLKDRLIDRIGHNDDGIDDPLGDREVKLISFDDGNINRVGNEIRDLANDFQNQIDAGLDDEITRINSVFNTDNFELDEEGNLSSKINKRADATLQTMMSKLPVELNDKILAMTEGGRGLPPYQRDVEALNPLVNLGKYDFNYETLELTRKEQSLARKIE